MPEFAAILPRTPSRVPSLPLHVSPTQPCRRLPDHESSTRIPPGESSAPTSSSFRGTPPNARRHATTPQPRPATDRPRLSKCPPPPSPRALVCPTFSEDRSIDSVAAPAQFLPCSSSISNTPLP